MHAWRNVTTEYCRFFTVIVPSENVKIGDTGEILPVTRLPGLSD